MKCKKKEIQLLFGVLLRPLKVGAPAVIVHTCGCTWTSPVRDITRLTPKNVEFETENSAYCLVPYRHPAATAQARPAAA